MYRLLDTIHELKQIVVSTGETYSKLRNYFYTSNIGYFSNDFLDIV